MLIGTAEKGNGVLRLLKTIRHDAPDVEATKARLGVKDGDGTVAQVMKTVHTAHGGKLSIARILSGTVADGAELWLSNGNSGKVSGIYRMLGKDQAKQASAKAGETVALGKLDEVKTGETLSSAKGGIAALVELSPPDPVFAIALRPKERKDEVKLSAALQRLLEEDPSVLLQHQQDSSRDGAVGPWRDASARHHRAARRAGTRSRSTAIRRPSPTARRSASRSASAAATRSSRAATASSATS